VNHERPTVNLQCVLVRVVLPLVEGFPVKTQGTMLFLQGIGAFLKPAVLLSFRLRHHVLLVRSPATGYLTRPHLRRDSSLPVQMITDAGKQGLR
jgi:hypothetical protein